jgi:hypothetical protein
VLASVFWFLSSDARYLLRTYILPQSGLACFGDKLVDMWIATLTNLSLVFGTAEADVDWWVVSCDGHSALNKTVRGTALTTLLVVFWFRSSLTFSAHKPIVLRTLLVALGWLGQTLCQ